MKHATDNCDHAEGVTRKTSNKIIQRALLNQGHSLSVFNITLPFITLEYISLLKLVSTIFLLNF